MAISAISLPSGISVTAVSATTTVRPRASTSDTPTCATSTRKFNEAAAKLDNTVVVVVSGDLPFAAKRFCTTEGIENVVTASTFRGREFAKAYGVDVTSGPLKGLTARAVVVVDADNKVLHAELVPEIKNEPNYDAAIAALK